MSLETIVNDLVLATDALHDAITDKRTVLDNAAQQAAASLTTTKGLQTQAAASAAIAAAKATEATNNATQIAAYKTAAAALDTTTTATAAVANLLPDLLAKKDPARHPFRKKMPTLVLDFERQKCHRYSPSTGFGETPLATFMTFARNSTATYTGPDSLIKTAAANEARYDYDPQTGECKGLLVEEQRTNLLRYSSDKLQNWTTIGGVTYPNNTISLNGTLSSCLLVEDAAVNAQHGVYKGCASVAAGTYTYTVYVKPAGRTHLSLVAYGASMTTVTMAAADVTTFPAVGNGFYRVSWTFSVDTASNVVVENWLSTSVGGGYYYTGDGTSGMYFWGAQLEAGAFPTSYIPTPATFTGRASTATYLDANGVLQTAASGVARSNAYDYDADGVLRPIGLLLENSATNQLLYSEQFDNAAWAKYADGTATAPVVTANYGVAPDGQTTADRVVFALNGGTTIDDRSELRQPQTTVAGTTYTQSVWLKTTDASTKVVALSFDSGNTKLITVTGTWQRFSNTGVASDTNRGFRLDLRGTTGTSDSADVLIWGAQQGVGSYPSSYIPTTSAQVTRAADTSTSAQATRVADDASLSGTNFSSWYNQEQGTLTIRGAVQLGGTVWPGLAVITDSSNSNRWGFYVWDRDDKVKFSSKKNAADWATAGLQLVTAHAPFSVASAVKYATTSSVLQGGSVANINAAGAVPRVSSLKIGVFDHASNSCIRRITYYPTALTNEELQVLTSA